MGKKQDVISDIFQACKRKGNFIFDNDTVKRVCKKHGFGNPFDATKLDSTSIFPQILLGEDYFLLHLGGGKHQFVKGIQYGFHRFEEIDPADVLTWKYRPSVLNEIDTSESNILSVAANQRIIHDFLYKDIIASPKVYNARRTKIGMSYNVGNEHISTQNLQMEIDLTMELSGVVTVFEGKNGFPNDFAVYQLFNPFVYYTLLRQSEELKIEHITCCYVLREKQGQDSILRLYNYTFQNHMDMASIRLLKSAQYNLARR
ncbi:MAG: hypothetical protein FJY66_00250 [Calditrichaeota bacterium]|nr:hypothetical protein [Calditrichota bacterium]